MPLKHTRPGVSNDAMTYQSYPHDISLCPIHAIREYIDFRGELCGESNMFITTTKPYHAAHHDTIARWIKGILCDAGIDTRSFQAHSCRAASTSAASLNGVSLSTIIKSASWSNVTTFKKHYLRDISQGYDLERENFGVKLLEQFSALS